MRHLRVLHVIGGGDIGGAMTHLLPLLSALADAECEVRLLCLGEGGLADGARQRGLPVVVLPMDSPWDPAILRPVRRVLAHGPAAFEALAGGRTQVDSAKRLDRSAKDWDIVHTHGMRANLPVRLGLQSLRRKPCLFTTVHSDLRLDYASAALGRVYQGLDRVTLRAVDKVVCVSDALRLLLIERGYPADRLITIRSGIEWPSSSCPPKAAIATVGHAGAAEPPGRTTRPRIGTVARLAPVKDVDLLIEIVALLRETAPELECIVVGDGPERARLESLANSLGLGAMVRFTGRAAEVEPLLAELDVFVVTSVFEGGVSMSVLEAMAAELPVVTTAAGGVAEAVSDGETGYVVTREQERTALAATMAKHIALLLTDSELRARMGSAGADRVRGMFLAEHAAVATLRAYERSLVARCALLWQ